MSALTEQPASWPASWTVKDVEALPEDGSRYEIIDGSLHVTPPPTVAHQRVVSRLLLHLANAAPDDVEVLPGAGVTTTTSFVIPDLLAVRQSALAEGSTYLEPADVVLAVEVVSPSSRTHDLVTKRAMYADRGIEHYWVVEVDPLRIRALRLVAGEYEGAAQSTGRLEIFEPFPVLLDLDHLLGYA